MCARVTGGEAVCAWGRTRGDPERHTKLEREHDVAQLFLCAEGVERGLRHKLFQQRQCGGVEHARVWGRGGVETGVRRAELERHGTHGVEVVWVGPARLGTPQAVCP